MRLLGRAQHGTPPIIGKNSKSKKGVSLGMAVTQIINGETYIQIESNTIVSPGSPPPILIPISTPSTEMTVSI